MVIEEEMKLVVGGKHVYVMSMMQSSLVEDSKIASSSSQQVQQCQQTLTVRKPSMVPLCVVGNFVGSDLQLVLAKATRLEIHLVEEEAVMSISEVNGHGTILVLKSFKPAVREQIF